MNFLFHFELSRSTQNEIAYSFGFILRRSAQNEIIITFYADIMHTFFLFHFAFGSVLNDKCVNKR